MLRNDGLAFSPVKDLSYDNQYVLKVASSGALVMFDSGRLRSVQVAA